MNLVVRFALSASFIAAALFSMVAAAGPSSVTGTMTVDGKVWKITNVHAFATKVFEAPAVRLVLSDIALTTEVARDANDRGRMAAGETLDKMRAAGTLHGMAITLSESRVDKKMQTGSNELYDKALGRMQISGLDRFEQAASDAGTIAGRLSLTPAHKFEGGKTIAYNITFSAPIEAGDVVANEPAPARAAADRQVAAKPTADADGFLVPFRDSAARIAAAIAGADLSLTAVFPRAVKSYLEGDDPVMMIYYQFDTDNNVKTGSTLPAPTRGSDFGTIVILRKSGMGQPQEVMVTRNTVDPKLGNYDMDVKTNARLQVDGNSVRLLVPLSAMNLRKGQTVRLVVVFHMEQEYTEKTLTLQ